MTTTSLPRRATSPTRVSRLAASAASRKPSTSPAQARRRVLTLDNVERVHRLSAEALDRDYLRQGRPVVVTGLWEGHPAERLADSRQVRRAFGHVPLPITPNLLEEFLQGRDRPEPRWLSLADFHQELVAGSRQMCLEHDVPAEVEAQLPPSPYLAAADPADFWVSQMFMAGPGNHLHLHYDMDLRHVVMHQVLGRKRYVLIDAAQTRKLAAGAAANVPYTSGMYLQNFSPEDLVDFLRYVKAWDCVLEPGEALAIPATTWHYVEYVDLALSLNVRLPRNRYMRWLGDTIPTTTVELQALAQRFRDEDAVDAPTRQAFATLVAAAGRRYPHEDARSAALDRLVADLASQLGLPIATPPYQVADIARRAHREQWASLAPARADGAWRSARVRTGLPGGRRARG